LFCGWWLGGGRVGLGLAMRFWFWFMFLAPLFVGVLFDLSTALHIGRKLRVSCENFWFLGWLIFVNGCGVGG